jgi:hypothetical protein
LIFLHDLERKNTTSAMRIRHAAHRLSVERAANGRRKG